jgi:hypothetical protein
VRCTLGARIRSESQSRHGSQRVDVCRDANLSPAVCIGCARRLGLASVLNGVAAQQKMCRETIAGSQTKDDLSHPGRIAILSAPERLQRLDDRPYGRFILREQVRYVLVRTNAPVRPHATGFERTHLDAKRGHFLGQGFGESANSPLGGVVRSAAGKSQATAH